jgi:hypothetical protein
MLRYNRLRCWWWHKHRLNRRAMKHECVVDLHELVDLVLFQADEALQRRRLLSSTAHAVHYVTFLLFSNEENVEDFGLRREIKCFTISLPLDEIKLIAQLGNRNSPRIDRSNVKLRSLFGRGT